jgi:cytochrome P450
LAYFLCEREFLTNAKFVFGAGFETSAYLLGNSLVALLRHPDQLNRLRRDPSLMPLAVEELLRFDNSIQWQERRALSDVVLSGETITAGERVVTLIGAANRDPAQFPDPDRLDIERNGTKSVSFGGGTHYCVGASLARVELQTALTAVVRLARTIESAFPPVRRPSFAIRGYLSVPITFR